MTYNYDNHFQLGRKNFASPFERGSFFSMPPLPISVNKSPDQYKISLFFIYYFLKNHMSVRRHEIASLKTQYGTPANLTQKYRIILRVVQNLFRIPLYAKFLILRRISYEKTYT